jgi:uncharacterized protein
MVTQVKSPISPPAHESASPSRKAQAIEVGIFLLLIVPSMVISLLAIRQGKVGFVVTAIATIARDLALMSLVLFFVWRNGEGFASLGWTSKNWSRQVALGLVLFPIVFLGAAALESFLKRLGLSSPSTPLPSSLSFQGWLEVPLALLLVIVVAVAEETIFRGYLILRFTFLSGNVPAALVVSSIIFSLGHGYEGLAGLTTVGILGLIFAIIYVRTGSLVAPMVLHFLQDFVGIVLAPIITAHSHQT